MMMIRCASNFCGTGNILRQMAHCVSTESLRGKRIKTFEIYRYDPEKTGSKPHLQVESFFISFLKFERSELIY